MAWPSESGCGWVSWVPDCHVFSTFPICFLARGSLTCFCASPVLMNLALFLSPAPLSLCFLCEMHKPAFMKETLLCYRDCSHRIMLYIRQWFPPVAMQIKHNINSCFPHVPAFLADFYHSASMRDSVSASDLTPTPCPAVKVGCVWVVYGWPTMCWRLCPGCVQKAFLKTSKWVEPVQVCMRNECQTGMAAWLGWWQSLSVSQSTHHFGSDWNSSTAIEWIAMEFGPDIHGSQMIYLNDLGDPLTFPVATPWGTHVWVSVKCNNYWMDEIWLRYSCSPLVEL